MPNIGWVSDAGVVVPGAVPKHAIVNELGVVWQCGSTRTGGVDFNAHVIPEITVLRKATISRTHVQHDADRGAVLMRKSPKHRHDFLGSRDLRFP